MVNTRVKESGHRARTDKVPGAMCTETDIIKRCHFFNYIERKCNERFTHCSLWVLEITYNS